ncbi:MAG TPA: multicopper oxidase family protein [Gemmatimonadaceae bacterium]|nr:multicopper oxidase family protein [Gemmatimonadaceae bacterium]
MLISPKPAILLAAVIQACSSRPNNDPARQTMEGTFKEPPFAVSTAGVLRISLTPRLSTVDIAGRQATLMAYNGLYTPPALRVHPGDTIRLRLTNALTEPTNFHTHGLTVSPSGNSDNVFLRVAPGQTQNYEFLLPADHPPGLFWYHPHPHGFSDEQVRNGMGGALIVEGLLDSFPTLRHIPERVLLLKGLQLENGRVVMTHIGEHVIRTINGVVKPVIVLRPGETELWRIGNQSADLYFLLTLDGHHFQLVARDGNRRTTVTTSDTVRLSPGARAEVLLTAGAPGNYLLRTGNVDTGPEGNQYDGTIMATVRVEGTPATPAVVPATLLPVQDLRGKVTNRRTIVFSETSNGDTLFINGKTFDPNRTDVRVKFGAIEEWTIRNVADELHTFHIHQGPFQLVEINGVSQPVDDHRDIVDVPIGGEVKVIIPFTNPLTIGRFVFHCHILSHEDKGMMATIEVSP